MKAAEKAGLVKFDFLGLSTMTIITACADDVQRLYGKKIDFDVLPMDDQGVFDLISQGHTDGVFQLESPGMRRVAVQIQPDSFADIIAMVALFRPVPWRTFRALFAVNMAKKTLPIRILYSKRFCAKLTVSQYTKNRLCR